MRFRQIEAFRAAMLTGSVTGAASLLQITQPSASRLLADLEDSLEFKLFHRTGGRLSPTQEGLQFYAAVDHAFVGLQKLEAAADRIRETRGETLTICALPVLAATLVPAAIRLFQASHPDVNVTIDILHPPSTQEVVQSGQADLALSQEMSNAPGVEQIALAEVAFVAALPAGHPLTAKEQIDLADFHDQDFISILPLGPLSWNRTDELFREHGIRPRRRIATTHSMVAYAMVAQGVGIGLFEPFAANTYAPHGVVLRPVSTEVRYRYSVLLPTRQRSPHLTAAFTDCLRQALREAPPALNSPDCLTG